MNWMIDNYKVFCYFKIAKGAHVFVLYQVSAVS